MATSGSVDFDQSAANIIKDALILVGGIEDDETPTASQEAYAMRALNRMVKAWSVRGLKVWAWQEATLTLVAAQQSYSLKPSGGDLAINKPIEIDNVRRVVNGVETPIDLHSRQVYMDQPEKDSTGKVNYVFYQEGLSEGTLYVWPAPDAADSIKFSYKSYIEDFDTTENTPFFPAEWLEALVYGLAWRLCPMYEVTGQDRQEIRAQAIDFLSDAETNDTDQGSIYLVPETGDYR